MKIRSLMVIATATMALTLGACSSDMHANKDDMMKANTAMTPENHVVMVGGAPMYPSKNIIENAVNSKDHTTLVAAVKAAGLVDTLSGPGPFTVFAPTNAAFDKLPAGTVDSLLKPENKPTLTKILTYHVVPGTLTAKDLMQKAMMMGGMYEMTTVEGGTITAEMKDGALYIVDEKGNWSKVTTANVMQSNGVIHVVDTVLMPN
ncbi:fasciclin domain-containing protein [Thalassospira marina]|uniref:Fasciclin n=1 Tax=Thalassospira marina TaxID=2048283 RepID=A0A2N3KZH6_9PROT|nr:fasciclin domain-containing protein [Thalassospira marina]AUG51951.1 fasciclin [Thalassospira marina]PKR55880.1 fasciclin [Thalassospira marina]